MSEPNSHMAPLRNALICQHAEWIRPFGGEYLHQWRTLCNKDQEAAICEAAYRVGLEHHGVIVQ